MAAIEGNGLSLIVFEIDVESCAGVDAVDVLAGERLCELSDGGVGHCLEDFLAAKLDDASFVEVVLGAELAPAEPGGEGGDDTDSERDECAGELIAVCDAAKAEERTQQNESAEKRGDADQAADGYGEPPQP